MGFKETVAEYDQQFSMLVHKLLDLSEDDCRRIFVKGLSGNIAEYVCLQKPDLYEEAVQYALDKEEAMSASYEGGQRESEGGGERVWSPRLNSLQGHGISHLFPGTEMKVNIVRIRLRNRRVKIRQSQLSH